jgi:hypothetical protein
MQRCRKKSNTRITIVRSHLIISNSTMDKYQVLFGNNSAGLSSYSPFFYLYLFLDSLGNQLNWAVMLHLFQIHTIIFSNAVAVDRADWFSTVPLLNRSFGASCGISRMSCFQGTYSDGWVWVIPVFGIFKYGRSPDACTQTQVTCTFSVRFMVNSTCISIHDNTKNTYSILWPASVNPSQINVAINAMARPCKDDHSNWNI